MNVKADQPKHFRVTDSSKPCELVVAVHGTRFFLTEKAPDSYKPWNIPRSMAHVTRLQTLRKVSVPLGSKLLKDTIRQDVCLPQFKNIWYE